MRILINRGVRIAIVVGSTGQHPAKVLFFLFHESVRPHFDRIAL